MGVYIKGMDKPKRCSICPLCRYYHENGNVWCNALNVILESIPYEVRLLDSVLDSIEPHKDCPLVEVKTPHGRLIDGSQKITVQVYDDMFEEWSMESVDVDEALRRWADEDIVTVIEAEVE